MIVHTLELEHDAPDGLEEPYDIACNVFRFRIIFLSDFPSHLLTTLSSDYRVQFPPIVLKHLRSIKVLLYPLHIYCHFESVVCVPDSCWSWHPRFFKMLIDWHHVNSELHLLVDVLSKHLLCHVEMSLIEELGKTLVDMTVHLLRCIFEGTSLVDRKSLG